MKDWFNFMRIVFKISFNPYCFCVVVSFKTLIRTQTATTNRLFKTTATIKHNNK